MIGVQFSTVNSAKMVELEWDQGQQGETYQMDGLHSKQSGSQRSDYKEST